MKYKNIFYCTAIPTKDAGSHREYFINNTVNFTNFLFPPGYSKDSSYVEVYKNGKRTYSKKFSVYKGNNIILKNIFFFLYFLYCLLFLSKRKSFVITNAPIYCFLNSIFSVIKNDKYVLWIGDYYPQKSLFFNLYNFYLKSLNKSLKYIIFLSPRLQNVYKNTSNTKNNFRETITLGIKEKSSPENKILKGKIKLGFVGIIRKGQGLDLVFKALKASSDFHLDVIGDGYYLPYYKNLASKMKIKDKIKFYGAVDDYSAISRSWDIGVALYENSKTNLSYYCEPTKIKDYLSFGLPVVTTSTTYFAEEIRQNNAGIVIEEDANSLITAVAKIKSDYSKYIGGVKKLVRKYDYKSWYFMKFRFLEY